MKNNTIYSNPAKVTLLAMSPNPVNIVVTAIKTCRMGGSFKDVIDNVNYTSVKDKADLILKVINMGHMSVIEHVYFTFGIEDISRACSHQLVRHRIAAISQESQRTVDMTDMNPIIPYNIYSDKDIYDLFLRSMDCSRDIYTALVDNNVPEEDARYVMPNASPTKMVMSMNARELHHFFDLRLCEKAQEEIREVAYMMKKIVQEECYELFPDEITGPQCVKLGTCPNNNKICLHYPALHKRQIKAAKKLLGIEC